MPQVAAQAALAPGMPQRRAGFRATLTQSSFLFFLLVCDHVASSTHAPSEGHDAQARTHSVKARAPVAPFLRHRFVGFLSTHAQVFVGASSRCQDSESRPFFESHDGPAAPTNSPSPAPNAAASRTSSKPLWSFSSPAPR